MIHRKGTREFVEECAVLRRNPKARVGRAGRCAWRRTGKRAGERDHFGTPLGKTATPRATFAHVAPVAPTATSVATGSGVRHRAERREKYCDPREVMIGHGLQWGRESQRAFPGPQLGAMRVPQVRMATMQASGRWGRILATSSPPLRWGSILANHSGDEAGGVTGGDEWGRACGSGSPR